MKILWLVFSPYKISMTKSVCIVFICIYCDLFIWLRTNACRFQLCSQIVGAFQTVVVLGSHPAKAIQWELNQAKEGI